MKKRLLALLMTAVLTVGSCATVMADENVSNEDNSVITVEEQTEPVSPSDTEESVVSDTENEVQVETVPESDVVVDSEAVSEEVEIISDDSVTLDEEAEVITEDSVNEDGVSITEDEEASSDGLKFEEDEEAAEDGMAVAKKFNPNVNSFDDDLTDMIGDNSYPAAGEAAASSASSEYYGKRIILLMSYDDIISDYGAIDAASDGDMTIMQYATESATKKAYEKYLDLYGEKKVELDHLDSIGDIGIGGSDVSSVAGEAASYTSYTPEYFAKKMGAPTFVKRMSSSMKSKQIIVADLDTGLNTSHEKIKGKYVKGKGYYEYNNGSTKDDHGHGTETASCILGVTKGTNVKVMPVKVLDYYGSGYSSVIAAGVKWAVNHGANVINMSLGGIHSASCNCYNSAINYAYSKNVTVVVAAGNENSSITGKTSYGKKYAVHPASIKKCITVAATDANDKRAYFSNYGSQVDVTSYGEDIYMPTYGSKTAYVLDSGTSFSCPLVSGAAALMYASGLAKKPAAVESLLRKKAKDLGASGFDKYYGAGTVRIGGLNPCTGFNNAAITLKAGVSGKSSGFSNPKKYTVKFSSSNKKVVTVDSNGKLTARKAGKAVISAKANGKTYKCTVTVTK